MLSAYISHTDCLKHEMGSDHPECPERLHAIADMLLVKGLRDFTLGHGVWRRFNKLEDF